MTRANPTRAELAESIDHYCYRCRSGPGQPCRSRSGRETEPHVLRIYALRRAQVADVIASGLRKRSEAER